MPYQSSFAQLPRLAERIDEVPERYVAAAALMTTAIPGRQVRPACGVGDVGFLALPGADWQELSDYVAPLLGTIAGTDS